MSIDKKSTNTRAISRRKILQITAIGLLGGLVAPALTNLSPAFAATPTLDGSKVLIVYYSHSGNTAQVAKHISAELGGPLVELVPLHPYPEEYKATTEQAKRELKENFKPPLKDTVANVSAYDIIFVGSPNWWGTVAGPVRTFLSDHDLAGKKVAPFITHEGSALGKSVEDIKKMCPLSTILPGLAVRGGKAASAQADVAAWLQKLGMQK